MRTGEAENKFKYRYCASILKYIYATIRYGWWASISFSLIEPANFLIYSFSTVLCIWPQLNAFSAISALETSQKVQVLQQKIQVSLPYFLWKFSFKLKPIIIFIFEVSIIYLSTQIYWPQKIPFLSNMDILRADIFLGFFSKEKYYSFQNNVKLYTSE